MKYLAAFAFGMLLLSAGCKTSAPQAPQQEIGSISVIHSTCHSLTISVHISSNWKPAPNPNVSTYRVYRVLGPQSPTLMAQSDDSTIELTGLQEFMSYNIYVEARSRRKNGIGIPIYRKVGELTEVTPSCSTITPNSPQPGDVRLRHESTGRCLYGSTIDGRPVGTWTCWADPAMAVSLEPLGGSEVRLRLRATGKCLYGNPINGREVRSWVCWNDPNMVYVREDLGNNRLRLRHKATGQCMYGGTADGASVRNWPCWNDPNMVWVIDPL